MSYGYRSFADAKYRRILLRFFLRTFLRLPLVLLRGRDENVCYMHSGIIKSIGRYCNAKFDRNPLIFGPAAGQAYTV